MNKNLISIIVPIYNVERYLEQCLKSIINQSYTNLEIILLNDGSTDNSLNICEKYAQIDNRIVLINKQNEGYGKTVNHGFKIAKGQYIAIVEPDDWIELNMYEELLQNAIKFDADMVKSNFNEVIENNKKAYKHKDYPINTLFKIEDCQEILLGHPAVWTYLFKNSFLKSNNISFVEAPGAGYVDVKFKIDILINAERILYIPKEFYNYRIDSIGSSMSSYNTNVAANRFLEVYSCYKNNEKFTKLKTLYIEDMYLGFFNWFNKKVIDDITFETTKKLIEFISFEDISKSKLKIREKAIIIAIKNSNTKQELYKHVYHINKKINQKYYLYKILSELTFGKTRKKLKDKQYRYDRREFLKTIKDNICI